jgi:phosphoglycerate dehydrogenase-like enzyme
MVNIGRGALVDTGALVGALRACRLGGAELDVTDSGTAARLPSTVDWATGGHHAAFGQQ